MLPRLLITLILLSAVPTFAEQVGDFAPLETGNLWEYAYSYSNFDMDAFSAGDSEFSTKDSGLIQMQITGSATSGDSIFYFFRNCVTLASTPQTVVRPDTLFEVDGIISRFPSWRIGHIPNTGPLPVCTRHSFNSSDSSTTADFYELPDFQTDLRVVRQIGMTREYFAPDTGLISCYNETGPTCMNGFGLISFTRAAPISIQTVRPLEIHRTPAGKPSAVMVLPNLSISKNGKGYNLLGRINRDNSNNGLHRMNIYRIK